MEFLNVQLNSEKAKKKKKWGVEISKWNKLKITSKIVIFNPIISIITWDVNNLNIHVNFWYEIVRVDLKSKS